MVYIASSYYLQLLHNGVVSYDQPFTRINTSHRISHPEYTDTGAHFWITATQLQTSALR
jgi:hypothetical protein